MACHQEMSIVNVPPGSPLALCWSAFVTSSPAMISRSSCASQGGRKSCGHRRASRTDSGTPAKLRSHRRVGARAAGTARDGRIAVRAGAGVVPVMCPAASWEFM